MTPRKVKALAAAVAAGGLTAGVGLLVAFALDDEGVRRSSWLVPAILVGGGLIGRLAQWKLSTPTKDPPPRDSGE
jgi:hypothetical protein